MGGGYVKEYMMKVVDTLCPGGKKTFFFKYQFLCNTVVENVTDFTGDIQREIKEKCINIL
jgi:hypothetical protein